MLNDIINAEPHLIKRTVFESNVHADGETPMTNAEIAWRNYNSLQVDKNDREIATMTADLQFNVLNYGVFYRRMYKNNDVYQQNVAERMNTAMKF